MTLEEFAKKYGVAGVRMADTMLTKFILAAPDDLPEGKKMAEHLGAFMGDLESAVKPPMKPATVAKVEASGLKVGDQLNVMLINGLGQRIEYPTSTVVALFTHNGEEWCVVELLGCKLGDPFYGTFQTYLAERAVRWKEE